MGWKFNPFTGALDQTGSGGGGSSYIDGEVATYNDLPLDGTAALNSAWLVRSASGVWPVSRKQAGIYIRTATAGSSRDADYTYAGTMPDVFSDAQFTLYDDADTTKNVKFNVGANVPTGNTVTLTAPASSGTLALGNQSVNDTDSPSFLGIYVGTNAANATNIGEVTITSSGLALSMEEPNGGQVSMRWFSPATTGDGNHWGFGCDTLNTNENNFFVWDFINNRPALWTNGATGNVVFGGEYAEGTLPAKVQVIGISPSTATLLGLDNKTAGAVAQKIRAAVSQSANLSEWLDSSGNLLLSVNSSGNLVLHDNVGGANTATFTASSQLTGNRSYNVPDASGTLMLVGDPPAAHAITSASHTAGNHKIFYSDGSGNIQELALGAASTVLTSNGSTSAPSFAAAAGGGVTGAASSASDVLGVSGSDITGVDANADRIVFWDDSASALKYLEAGSGLLISGTTMTVTATGGATNLWIAASQFVPRTTNGCGVDSRETSTNRQNFDELLFDAGTDEFAQALIKMPSNYNNGTITARFYWTASSGSGSVIWGIQGRAFADDDALDTAAGTAQTVTDTLLAANDMHVSAATSAVTIGGTPAANTPIQFQIYRDADAAGDTLAVDARLLGVEIIFD